MTFSSALRRACRGAEERNAASARPGAGRRASAAAAMNVSQWAPRYRRFPDDDAYPRPWKHETAPELVEIMDALSPHDPCEEVPLIKCAQSGGSASAENWIGYVSDNCGLGPMLFVQATLQAAWDWAAEKFWPMVEATPRLNPDKAARSRRMGCPTATGRRRRRSSSPVERLCAAGRRQQRRRAFASAPCAMRSKTTWTSFPTTWTARAARRNGQPAPEGLAPAAACRSG
jgi:hypothetical protein